MIILGKCNYCGKLFIKKHNAEKYCSTPCRRESTLENKREWINKRNVTRKNYNTRIKNITELGSLGTNSSYHMKSNFDDEFRSVRSQIRMLKI